MEDGYMCFKGTRSPPQVLGPPDKQHISMATQQEHQSEKMGAIVKTWPKPYILNMLNIISFRTLQTLTQAST